MNEDTKNPMAGAPAEPIKLDQCPDLNEMVELLTNRCIEQERAYSIVVEAEVKPNDAPESAHVVRTCSGSLGLSGGIRIIGDLSEVMMSEEGLTMMELSLLIGMIARRNPEAQSVVEWRKIAEEEQAKHEAANLTEKEIN